MKRTFLFTLVLVIVKVGLAGEQWQNNPFVEEGTSDFPSEQLQGNDYPGANRAAFTEETDQLVNQSPSYDLQANTFDNGFESTFEDCCDNQAEERDIWSLDNYFFVGYTGGRGLSYKRGYGTAGVFLTPPVFADSNWVPFFDLRGYVLGDGKWAANAGGGLRYIVPCWDVVVGVNAYYDYREFHRRDFNQIGVGLEILSRWIDFRVNGYFPLNNEKHRKGTLFDLGDDLYAVRFRWEQPYRGVDAELGLWIWDKTPCNWLGIYVAAGPYYYTRDRREHTVRDHHRSFTGGHARILAKINDYLDVSVRGTYDNFFHGTVQGQITLTIPFCNPFRNV